MVPGLHDDGALIALAMQGLQEARDVVDPGSERQFAREFRHRETIVPRGAIVQLDVEQVFRIAMVEVQQSGAAVLPMVHVELEAGQIVKAGGGDQRARAIHRVDEVVFGRAACLRRAEPSTASICRPPRATRRVLPIRKSSCTARGREEGDLAGGWRGHCDRGETRRDRPTRPKKVGRIC